MKTNYFFPMLITVFFFLPVILVCQTSVIELSYKTGEQNLKFPTDNNLLFGQLSNPSDEGAIASQDFTDSTDYSCQATDDFIVPDGETWSIDLIQILGVYSAGGGIAQLAHLMIYSNNPEFNIPDFPVSTYLDYPIVSTSGGTLTFDMTPNPIILVAGQYWIIVQPQMAFTPFGQWAWKKQESPTILNEFHWLNPGGGFGVPGSENWLPGSSVFGGTDHNLAFGLYGAIGNPPEVNAGPDATICADAGKNCYQCNGSATNYKTLLWDTSGDGVFNNPNILNPVYCPGVNDITNGFVTLTLSITYKGTASSTSDFMILTIQALPEVDAGPDANVSEGETYQLAATAENYSNLLWATSGSGSFSPQNSLDAVYSASQADIETGSVDLCITVYPIDPCTLILMDCMELSFQHETSVNAGPDATICADEGKNCYQCNGSATNYKTLLWDTDGDGVFDDPYRLNPVYCFGVNDITYGFVTLTLSITYKGTTSSTSDFMILTIQSSPTVNAGADAVICENDSYTFFDATAANYNSLLWTTSGNGTFFSPSDLNPVYTPGTGEAGNTFTLCLMAQPINPCTISAADCMNLTIQALPEVEAGPDANISCGETYLLAATAGNYSNLSWSTSGSGGFNPQNNLSAFYTPSQADIDAGSVVLCLTAYPVNPCTLMLTDCMILDITCNLDWGDAPEDPGNSINYPTSRNNNGARHIINPAVYLCNLVSSVVKIDAESDGQPNNLATGDDTDLNGTSLGDDEDGVDIPATIQRGSQINITVWPSVSGYLDAWIDYNTDGDWNEDDEHVFANEAVNPPSIPLLTPIVPAGNIGISYARFRFRTANTTISYDGLVSDGEVEDYYVRFVPPIDTIDPPPDTICTCIGDTIKFTVGVYEGKEGIPPYTYHWTSDPPGFNSYLENPVVAPMQSTTYFLSVTDAVGQVTFDDLTHAKVDTCDYGDAPEGWIGLPTPDPNVWTIRHYNYPTSSFNKGAAHRPNANGVFLDSLIDFELQGQSHFEALGDDIDLFFPSLGDDEDGVRKSSNVGLPGTNIYIVTAHQPGYLNAWVDFDGNYSWEPAEQVFINRPLIVGDNEVTFNTPAYVNHSFNTFARFRYTSAQSIPVTGEAKDGEVEDYMIPVESPNSGSEVAIVVFAEKWNVTCLGGNDGEITLSVSGGAPPYTYLWNNGATIQNLTGLSAGQYSVNITDTEGLETFSSFTIFEFQHQTADAGPDQLNIPDTWITLQGNQPIGGSGMWSIISGEGGIIDDASNPFSNFHGVEGQIYILRWTITNYCNISPDECEISFMTGPKDFGDAPEPYPTLLSADGARHLNDGLLYLGNHIDNETDGQPSVSALGDDVNNLADEDGVQFVGSLSVGNVATFNVLASGAGFLNAWMDFNSNGSWAESSEQIFTNIPLTAGNNTLTFNIPASTLISKTFTRFRFDSQGNLSYTGLAIDGEVEDYLVKVKPNWMPGQTNRTHLIAIPANISMLEPYDVIGVFYQDNQGVEKCGGMLEWMGQTQVLIAYGDDNTTPQIKEGFAEGETFAWKVFSDSMGIVKDIMVQYDPSLPNYDGTFVNIGVSAITAIFNSQSLNMAKGWSGISSYLLPVDPQVANMFSPLNNSLFIMYNFEGLYWPSQGVNTLGNWNTWSGYVVKLTENAVLNIYGSEAMDKNVNLAAGWNLIPVLSTSNANVVSMFAGVTGFYAAKDVAGQGVYWPVYNYNSLGNLKTGKSYLICMTSPGSITFPSGSFKTSTIGPVAFENVTSWKDVVYTPVSHLVAFTDNATSGFENGDIIAAFTPSGLCAGMNVYSNDGAGLTLNGDDNYSGEVDGFAANEDISYKLYRPSTSETFDLQVTYDASLDNTGKFAVNSMSAITEVKMSATGIEQHGDSHLRIYPNPTKGVFTVEGMDNNASIRIYNTFGEEIYVNTHTASGKIDLSGHSKGVYFIRIETAEGTIVEKLVIN